MVRCRVRPRLRRVRYGVPVRQIRSATAMRPPGPADAPAARPEDPPVPKAAGGAPARGRGRGAPPPPVAAHMIAMDLKNPARPISRFFTSTARPNGAWSRAGLAWAHDSLIVQTADGPWEPAQGLWGQTLLRLAPRTLNVLDYFTPPNLQELNANDLDYGSGGTLGFTFQNRDLVVSGGKDGTIYLLDAKSLGGADHRTPLFSFKAGNDELSYASMGVWGAPATYRERAKRAMGVLSDVGPAVESRRRSPGRMATPRMAASWRFRS